MCSPVWQFSKDQSLPISTLLLFCQGIGFGSGSALADMAQADMMPANRQATASLSPDTASPTTACCAHGPAAVYCSRGPSAVCYCCKPSAVCCTCGPTAVYFSCGPSAVCCSCKPSAVSCTCEPLGVCCCCGPSAVCCGPAVCCTSRPLLAAVLVALCRLHATFTCLHQTPLFP